jgi:nitrogen fixation/metabolism regulation signal transduction histidine kinase
MTQVAVRLAVIGILACVAAWLLSRTQLYATALVLVAFGAVLYFDLVRRLPRAGIRRIESVAANGVSPALSRELDHANALLDTVPAALFVLESDRVVFMNRAGRLLARRDVVTLRDIAVFGEIAPRLAAMWPGAREVFQLADGTAAYVSCSQYSAPGLPPRKLLALQRIAGELDAVEAKAWGDMARVLAHEMMNSLTPIASLSESLEQLLQTRTGEEELVAALEVIRRRSHGLMQFVERYREVAELPSPQVRTLAMKPFLDGIERLMSATLRERHIVYASRLEPQDLVARADAELLEQALINLLRNAVEAVDGCESPHIEIECSLSGAGIAIEVLDNGRGLPDTERGKVLTPFFSTKPSGGGIGLSVARHVALAHGGQLNVRRRESGGAIFSLILPA